MNTVWTERGKGETADENGREEKVEGQRQWLTDYSTLSSLYLSWLDELLDVFCGSNSKQQPIRGGNQTETPAADFMAETRHRKVSTFYTLISKSAN